MDKNNKLLLTDYIKQSGTYIPFPKDGKSWVILSDIEQRIKEKIEKVGKPLKDWDINIYRGILTGCNEAFIINKERRDELIKKSPKSAEIIRPILRGRDIKRYGYEFADLYLLFIPWHFPLHLDTTITGASKEAELIFKKEYPAVYNHLRKYKNMLSARNTAETGIRYEWYALQRWGANYWEDFSKQKVVWARLMRISKNDTDDFPRFALATKENFVVDSLCFFTGQDIPYFQGILNSELAMYYFLNNIAILDDGGMQMRQQYIELMSIPCADEATKQKIIEIVKILNKKNDRQKENELNNIVYALYEFNQQEIYQIKCIIQEKTALIKE